ncbi:MAG: trehalose-phosphatase [Lautropia sp. SCN 66-9]|nr:MAG: trehalose-phosphatase [Lautropia sp. SCN 66-9]
MQSIFDADGERALAQLLAAPTLIAFDFDGTLVPIVARPEDSRLDERMRQALRALAPLAPLAIVSGRSAADLRQRAEVGARYLVGNHGNEGLPGSSSQAAAAIAICARWLAALRQRLPAVLNDPGVRFEDKTRTLSLHYRGARDPEAAAAALRGLIDELDPPPKLIGGKFVFNLLPPGALTKFEALQRLSEHAQAASLLFVGDDDTDELAFRQAPAHWLTVRVEPPADSHARFSIERQRQVVDLIDRLVARLRG